MILELIKLAVKEDLITTSDIINIRDYITSLPILKFIDIEGTLLHDLDSYLDYKDYSEDISRIVYVNINNLKASKDTNIETNKNYIKYIWSNLLLLEEWKGETILSSKLYQIKPIK